MLEHLRAALRTGADRGLLREVHRLCRPGVVAFASLAEIELQLVLGRDPQDRRERPAQPAAETLQRSDGSLPQQQLPMLSTHIEADTVYLRLPMTH